MAARPAPLTLTGILASTDSFGRLRLCLVDVLPSQDRPGGRPDGTWARLRAAVPARGGYRVPYDLPLGGAPDDAGIRGECWVTVAGGGARRRRLLALAEELRGREVAVTATPRRYALGEGGAAGTSLVLERLEPLEN